MLLLIIQALPCVTAAPVMTVLAKGLAVAALLLKTLAVVQMIKQAMYLLATLPCLVQPVANYLWLAKRVTVLA